MVLQIYKLTLAKSYYDKGFFNLGVDVNNLIRHDNGPITLLLGDERRAIDGRVDRNANQNGTPRVFGNRQLADWFQQNFAQNTTVDIEILSPRQLWLRIPNSNSSPISNSAPTHPQITHDSNSNIGNNFQRIGSISNAQAGNDFELVAQQHFASQGISLNRNYVVLIGIADMKKAHKFDLGSDDPKIIVECKSHTWTARGNNPSAKVSVWNEVMFYFMLAPKYYRKILFVLKSDTEKKKETLANYYIRTNPHLIPPGVEIWEFDPEKATVQVVWK